MWLADVFARFDSHQLLWIFGFALPGMIIAVAAIIAGVWWKLRKTQLEVQLKQSLAERGLSAEEIERVLKAPLGPPEE